MHIATKLENLLKVKKLQLKHKASRHRDAREHLETDITRIERVLKDHKDGHEITVMNYVATCNGNSCYTL